MSSDVPGDRVETVLGPIPPASLGATSMHEHVFIDARVWEEAAPPHDPPPTDSVGIEAVGYLRWNPGVIADNLILDDEEIAIGELKRFADAGGTAIVDLTCTGIGPRPEALVGVARASGLHIIAGCGFYVDASHPNWLRAMDVDEIAAQLIRDIEEGINGTSVKAGIIGEIGTSSPITEAEARVLRGAAVAASVTGATINVHVDESGMEGLAVLDQLTAEQVDLSRVVLSHMDQRLDHGYHRQLVDAGAVLSFDCFGSQCLNLAGLAEPNDLERLAGLEVLLGEGFAGQLVLGCDVWAKYMLASFGGLGYEHLLRRIVPLLRSSFAASTEEVQALVVDNPRRLLTIPAHSTSDNSPAGGDAT